MRVRSGLLKASGLCVAFGLVAVSPLLAHDFWIIPNAFAISSGGAIELRGQTSSNFPTSEAAVSVQRIAGARVLSAEGEARITDLTPDGTSLRLRHSPATDGQYLVAIELVPRETRTTGPGFKRWLELEGGASEADRLDHEGAFTRTDSGIVFRTTKYATTLVQVGRRGRPAFQRRAGFPVEFAPLSDPTDAKVGDTVSFQVSAGSNHMDNLAIHAGAASDSVARSVRGAQRVDPDLHLVSNEKGIVRIPLTKPGLWNVRTLHVSPRAGDLPGQWEIHWLTYVFKVSVKTD